MTAQLTTATDPPPAPFAASWDSLRRPEAWAGEIRVNLVRLVALVLFYGRHLIEFARAAPDASVRGRYHVAVTVLVLCWALMAVALHLLLSRRIYESWMKYAIVVFDMLMVTGLCVAAGGPRTPLVLLYFAVIASAPLRFSLKLIYVATAAAGAGYLFLLGYYAWYLIGYDRYYSTPDLRIPRSTEAITLLALLVTGLMSGQLVRQVRRMMEHQVMLAPPSSPSPGTPGEGSGEGRPSSTEGPP